MDRQRRRFSPPRAANADRANRCPQRGLEKMAHSPIIRIKHTRDERELLVVALQLLAMVMFNIKPVSVTVQIGKPITVKELGTTETQVIHQAVLAEMKRLIEESARRRRKKRTG